MAKTTVLNFTSVGDYTKVQASDLNKETLRASFARNTRNEKSCRAWFGEPTMADAEKILSIGWPDGVKTMKNILGKVQIPGEIKCIRKRLKYAGEGDEVDYERMMQGEVLCYKTWTYEPGFTVASDKQIRICVDMVASGWQEA